MNNLFVKTVVINLSIFATVIFCLIVNFKKSYDTNLFKDFLAFAKNGVKDDFGEYGNRFKGVKENIPKGEIVGYVDDKKDGGDSKTQYFLAPVIFEKSMDRPLILGNFQDSVTGREFAVENKLTIEKDFGNGVFLLRRRAE